MAVKTRDTTWSYPLVNVTSDLSVPKTSVAKGLFPSLKGVDGSLRGGVRPFPGMRTVHELDYANYSQSGYDITNNAGVSTPYSATNSVVTDFFPVSVVRTSSDSNRNPYQIQAFVYRVKKAVAGTDDQRAEVFIDYIDIKRADTASGGHNTNNLYTPADHEDASDTGNLLMYNLTGDQIDAPMDVKVFGKLIYVFVEGRMPAVAYFDDKAFNDANYKGLIVRGVTEVTGANGGEATNFRGFTGPGIRPQLFAQEAGSDFGTIGTDALSTTSFPSTQNELSPPGVGQVVITNKSPDESDLFAGGSPGTFTNPISPTPSVSRISQDVFQASGVSANLTSAVSGTNFSQTTADAKNRYFAVVGVYSHNAVPTITDVVLSDSSGGVLASTTGTTLVNLTKNKHDDGSGNLGAESATIGKKFRVYSIPGGSNNITFTDKRIKVTGSFGVCTISVFKASNVSNAADSGAFSMIRGSLQAADNSWVAECPAESTVTTSVEGVGGNVSNIRNGIHCFASFGIATDASPDIDDFDDGGQGFVQKANLDTSLSTYHTTSSEHLHFSLSALTKTQLASAGVTGTLIKGQHGFDEAIDQFVKHPADAAAGTTILGLRFSIGGQIFTFPDAVDSTDLSQCPGFVTGFRIRELTPGNQAELVPQEVRLNWEGFYASGENVGDSQENIVFDLYWQHDDDDGTVERVAEGLTSPTFDPGTLYSNGTLPAGKRFRWAVVARNTACNNDLFSTELSDGTTVAHAFVLSNIFEFTTIPAQEARRLDGGDYTFAYQLVDTRTGRKSQISTVTRVGADAFPLTVVKQDTVSGIELPTNAGQIQLDVDSARDVAKHRPRYAAMEIAYDNSEYDQAVFYRSLRLPPNDRNFRSALLLVDGMVTLSTIQTTKNNAAPFRDSDQTNDSSVFKHAVYYYRLQDRALAVSSGYFESFNHDEKIPKAGSAELLGNTMLLSSITNDGDSSGSSIRSFPNDPYRGVSEARYSSVGSYGMEMFPPQNVFIPPDPSNEIKRLIRVGPNIIGLSDDRMYIIRREGQIIIFREMHEGLTGVSSPSGAAVVGNQLFVVTSKGIKIIGSQGSLDAMNVMDDLIKSRWVSSLENVKLAYDPFTSCLFFLNTVDPTVALNAQTSEYAAESAVVWFETSSLTELKDMPFTDVKQGVIPNGETFDTTGTSGYSMNTESPTAKRAMFLQNHPKFADAPAGWKPKIMVMNHDRARKACSDAGSQESFTRRTMFDIRGTTRFTKSSASHSAGITSIGLSGTPLSNSATQASLVGAKIYITEDTNAANVGKSFYILDTNSGGTPSNNTIRVLGDTGTTFTRFVVSPVFVEVVGHALGLSGADSQLFELQERHIVKQASELVCTFVDVEGDASTDSSNKDDFFRGVVFSGNDETPVVSDVPVDPSGTQVKSVTNLESLHPAAFNASGGESDSFTGKQGPQGVALTVGFQTFCPDLDYRAISMQCEGRILGTQTTGRYSPS